MSWYTNLVGRAMYYQLQTICGGRVYPNIIAQDATFPCMSYSTTSNTTDYTKDSRSVADKLRITVDIFDKTIDGANIIASQVRDALDFTVGTIAGIPVDSIRYDGEVNLYENDVRIHHIAQDYIVRIPYSLSSGNVQNTVIYNRKTEDFVAENIIPPGYGILDIFWDNQAEFDAKLSAGTTANGNNVFSGVYMGNADVGISRGPAVYYSLTGYTSLYFNHHTAGDEWNNAEITFYIVLTKII